AHTVPVAADDVPGLVALAKDRGVDLVVVGPEAPLCLGLVDALSAVGVKAFGPSRPAAEIEGDKAFARGLCRRHRIPGPQFWVFEDLHQALAHLENRPEAPVVVKAAGLCAGKGVTVAKDKKTAAQ